MFTHAVVDTEFIHTAEHRAEIRQQLPASADRAFATLADAHAWTIWLGLDAVRWTSKLGPGATRDIKQGLLTIGEEFFVWEPGQVMSFRFTRSWLPLRAVAEEYRLRDNGDGTCEIVWSFAADAVFGPIAAAFIANLTKLGRKQLPELAVLLA